MAGRLCWEVWLGGFAGRLAWETLLGGFAGRLCWEGCLGGFAGWLCCVALLGGFAGRLCKIQPSHLRDLEAEPNVYGQESGVVVVLKPFWLKRNV